MLLYKSLNILVLSIKENRDPRSPAGDQIHYGLNDASFDISAIYSWTLSKSAFG